MNDADPGDIWEKIGRLDEIEALQVLTTLFVTYEKQQQRDPDNREARCFFKNLALALSLVAECNLNRR